MAGDFFKEYALYFVFVILLAVIITQDSTFLNITNLSNILTQSSVRMIIALGVAGVIVTRGTDLSVGRQVGLAAVGAATAGSLVQPLLQLEQPRRHHLLQPDGALPAIPATA